MPVGGDIHCSKKSTSSKMNDTGWAQRLLKSFVPLLPSYALSLTGVLTTPFSKLSRETYCPCVETQPWAPWGVAKVIKASSSVEGPHVMLRSPVPEPTPPRAALMNRAPSGHRALLSVCERRPTVSLQAAFQLQP